MPRHPLQSTRRAALAATTLLNSSLSITPPLVSRLLISRLLVSTLLLQPVLLAAPVARAQEPAPEERRLTPDERARELYLRGDRLYAEGSYDEAVVAFEQAYELSRRPPLLYDMANALERLGRYEEALHRLNQYVPSAPEHQRETVLKRIRALEARAEEQRHREDSESPAPAPEAPSASPRESAAAPAYVADEPASSPPIVGYAVGAGGLASIGVGIVFGIAASNARSDAEAQCVESGSGVFCPASVDDRLSTADGRALVADIALGLGLVAVGVGAYLVLSHDDDSGRALSLRAGASPGGGRMNLVTTF